jgi:hypothetical protein
MTQYNTHSVLVVLAHSHQHINVMILSRRRVTKTKNFSILRKSGLDLARRECETARFACAPSVYYTMDVSLDEHALAAKRPSRSR